MVSSIVSLSSHELMLLCPCSRIDSSFAYLTDFCKTLWSDTARVDRTDIFAHSDRISCILTGGDFMKESVGAKGIGIFVQIAADEKGTYRNHFERRGEKAHSADHSGCKTGLLDCVNRVHIFLLFSSCSPRASGAFWQNTYEHSLMDNQLQDKQGRSQSESRHPEIFSQALRPRNLHPFLV